ncbi:MAG: hypothetical protein F4153_05980, partial [Acidimicrobiia bacterium]|nr:hypothetical protein [Acidimicrobiia bacterium]
MRRVGRGRRGGHCRYPLWGAGRRPRGAGDPAAGAVVAGGSPGAHRSYPGISGRVRRSWRRRLGLVGPLGRFRRNLWGIRGPELRGPFGGSVSTTTTPSPANRAAVPATTSSRATQVLGWLTLAGFAVLVALAFAWVPEDTRVTEQGDVVGQFDAVRLMFVHVPSAIMAYTGFGLTFLASLAYLRWRTDWWDVMAHSSAEIGVLFGVLTLVTGSIWGRPIWQTWWEWGDVRLVTTLVMVLVFIGYLAVRRIPADAAVKARRSAVIALVGAVNIVIVNRSVDWWENRTLHQQ